MCSFCSQSAGSDLWQIGRRELKNVFSALKTVLLEVAIKEGRISPANLERNTEEIRDLEMPEHGLIGYRRLEHKPGVIFPYLDNDIFSYEYLYEYIKYLHEDLGAKVRLTTVGYSRHNSHLNVMHANIVKHLWAAVDGIRFSLTPYTYGWNKSSRRTKGIDRREFIADLSNMLHTYRPLIERLGIGKDKACVELRFPPLAYAAHVDLKDCVYRGRHLVNCGPYLLISRNQQVQLPLSTIESINGRVPTYSENPIPYFLLVSDDLINDSAVLRVADFVIDHSPDLSNHHWTEGRGFLEPVLIKAISVYCFANEDGPYYAIDPYFSYDGLFEAIHFYPRSVLRKNSGYINSTRYFLNQLVQYKRRRGLGKADCFMDASWNDVEELITNLWEKADTIRRYDAHSAMYISQEVLPIIEAYRDVLKNAGYEPYYFFDGRFTIDTGTIVNQGRATRHFHGLVSKSDVPVTPHEERGYGDVSFNSQRGHVFRLAPVPTAPFGGMLTEGTRGKRNHALSNGGLAMVELDGWLKRTTRPEILIEGLQIERIRANDMKERFLLPGLSRLT
jgi:hypothetical protein